MKLKRQATPNLLIPLDGLSWVPDGIRDSLAWVTGQLVEAFGPSVEKIGLYGSWQRGEAGPFSDVDLVVILNHEVAWFTAEVGMIDRTAARKDRRRWHALEKKINTSAPDLRVYSVAVVTPGMVAYYHAHGPIHLQNWARALDACHILWAR
jgi:predicted nucleotidyltransferase